VSVRVLVALDSRSGRRDALVLAAQLAGAGGALVVADLLPTVPTPLAGGSEAGARRRESLRDAGDEIYATLGPDPRVRYLPVSGLPFVDAVVSRARDDRAEIVVIGQSLARERTDIDRLAATAPCPIAVAPYGHRFVRTFAPARVGIAAGDARAERWLTSAPWLAPEAHAVTAAAGLAEVDLLVVGRADDEVLRQAHCPVVLVGERAAAVLNPAPARR
jgi:nucleotide-binding universal stress UspA family protein